MPVGPSPFNPAFPSWFKGKQRSNKNKKEAFRLMSKVNSRGIRAVYPKISYPKVRRSRILDGGDFYMPEQDYRALHNYYNENETSLTQGWLQGKKLARDIRSPADLVAYAFENKAQQGNIMEAECKGGHIKSLKYNALYSLLMVEFTKRGDTVVFFNLPNDVAVRLIILGKNGTMAPGAKGEDRHAVGVEFWNLVRVRGTLHKTYFPFAYTVDNRTGAASGRREGIGPDGKPSKYIYTKEMRPDARFKSSRDQHTDDNGVVDRYIKTPVAMLRNKYEYDEMSDATGTTDEWVEKALALSEDDAFTRVDDFFADGSNGLKSLKDQALENASPSVEAAIHKAEEDFDNDLPKANIIADLLNAGVPPDFFEL